MNVASLELCKELYELSGWDTTEFVYTNSPRKGTRSDRLYDRWRVSSRTPRTTSRFSTLEHVAAYDLGYLLTKLPQSVNLSLHGQMLGFFVLDRPKSERGKWRAFYTVPGYGKGFLQVSKTPEDTVCELLIELFKQGILTRESAPNIA